MLAPALSPAAAFPTAPAATTPTKPPVWRRRRFGLAAYLPLGAAGLAAFGTAVIVAALMTAAAAG